MHEFQRRMEQYLATLPQLSKGHQERLQRPIKQLDLECWGELEETSLLESMKVAVRSVAHELLDLQALQMEAAFARCRTPEQKTLLAALVAHKLPSGACILFRTDCGMTGFSYPAAELVIIEPQGNIEGVTYDFVVEQAARAGSALQVVPASDLPAKAEMEWRVAVQCLPSEDRTIVLGDVSSALAPVIRYSSDQVRENPFRCAAQVFATLERAGRLA